MKNIQLFNEDNLEVMKRLPDESIDVICIDPPYLYLKNQKLERPFNERFFFIECARLLTKNGFIVMFGRGDSFYRWNTLLNNLIEYKEGSQKYGYKVFDENGNIINKYRFKENIFTFKEEIVWDKQQISIPAAPILRVHELIVIFSKGEGKLNRSKVPYLESKIYDLDSLVGDIKRIKSAINSDELNDIKKFLESGETIYTEKTTKTFFKNSFGDRSRGLATFKSIKNGLREKTIIRQTRDHYTSIHPTQKPIRLLERILALVIPQEKEREEIIVADFFAGSMSCMEAVHNMGMQGIACEIDDEYFHAGKDRIEKITHNKAS